jgi:hypothetical protein
MSIVPRFVTHHHTKLVQAAAFEQAKRNSSHQNIVVQIDWAENYTCQWQDEVQAAHWHQRQISVFTTCFWLGENNRQCLVVISDNLVHDKETSSTSLALALERLLPPVSERQSLHIFSDGPTSQFKNRYMLAMLATFSKTFSFEQVQWSFFAASHGKGPVDGIGAVAKRLVWQAVRNRETLVNNAASFVATLEKNTKTLNVIHATEEEVNRVSAQLTLVDVFGEAPPVSGILLDHNWTYKRFSGILRSPLTQYLQALDSSFINFSSPPHDDGLCLINTPSSSMPSTPKPLLSRIRQRCANYPSSSGDGQFCPLVHSTFRPTLPKPLSIKIHPQFTGACCSSGDGIPLAAGQSTSGLLMVDPKAEDFILLKLHRTSSSASPTSQRTLRDRGTVGKPVRFRG